ncbi:MAG: L,D-transpeptidase [Acidobacteria bacterium]|nr:L,D-transpeptidase [Acidobacteriota bacterium]
MNLPVESTKIVVSKSARRLRLYSGDKLLRTYRVGLGFSPVKDKVTEGDGATPEGEFYIFTKNPESAYYLSLGVSYPNTEDAERGLRAQLISEEEYQQIAEANRNRTMPPQSTALGGLIYIHGHGSSKDWTWGCVALDDGEMLELFEAVQVGTKVVIEP